MPSDLATLVRADLPTGQVEWALSRLVRWSLRHDVHQETFTRAEVDITVADAWALGRVVECGPVRLTTLAERLSVDASTLTPRVRHLEEAGLLRRSSDPGDRRAVLIEATEQGLAAFAKLHAARRALLEDALADTPADLRRRLGPALAALADRLDAVMAPTA